MDSHTATAPILATDCSLLIRPLLCPEVEWTLISPSCRQMDSHTPIALARSCSIVETDWTLIQPLHRPGDILDCHTVLAPPWRQIGLLYSPCSDRDRWTLIQPLLCPVVSEGAKIRTLIYPRTRNVKLSPSPPPLSTKITQI